jgi:hypothetical protein
MADEDELEDHILQTIAIAIQSTSDHFRDASAGVTLGEGLLSNSVSDLIAQAVLAGLRRCRYQIVPMP